MTIKAGLLAIWSFCIAAFVVATESGVMAFGRGLFWLLVVVHAVECVVFLPTLRRTGRPLAGHLAQVMLFGVFHYREVRQELDAASPAAS